MIHLRRILAGAAGMLFTLVAGCTYLGSARPFDPNDLDREPGWVAVRTVPPLRQEGAEECGLAALQMVLAFWEQPAERDRVLAACPAKAGEGIKAGDLRDFARRSGLQAYLIHGEWMDFQAELSRGHPVIVGLVKPYITGVFSHYEVVVAFHPETRDIVTLDPAEGWRRNTSEGFRKEWDPSGRLTLILYEKEAEASAKSHGKELPSAFPVTPR